MKDVIQYRGKGCHCKITIRHLLEHSAGWDRDVVGDHVFWYNEDKYKHLSAWDAVGLVNFVLTQELQFKPGECSSLTNTSTEKDHTPGDQIENCFYYQYFDSTINKTVILKLKLKVLSLLKTFSAVFYFR